MVTRGEGRFGLSPHLAEGLNRLIVLVRPLEPPAPEQYARSVNGYELPIAMEVRRGRYLASYEQPRPLPPNTPMEWKIPLRDRDHVFLKGHRLMVQVQSTWFPLIDRNPQKFVPSIYRATAADFIKATQRVYCSASRPSLRIRAMTFCWRLLPSLRSRSGTASASDPWSWTRTSWCLENSIRMARH